MIGDIERADAWDETPTIDPLQVARRLHMLRSQVDLLAGRTTARWGELPDVERHILEGVGEAIRIWVVNHEPDNPALTARHVHTVRVFLTGEGRDWDDLSPDEQQIAIDLVDLIIDWLDTEGPR